MKLSTDDVNALLGCLAQYFTGIGAARPEFGVPYTIDTHREKMPFLAYSGHIGISGNHRGGLVITCNRGLADALLSVVLGGAAESEDDAINMLAEMANTIAGNARVHFGNGFEISVPLVVVGEPEEIRFVLADPTLVIPFTWQGHAANAIIGLA